VHPLGSYEESWGRQSAAGSSAEATALHARKPSLSWQNHTTNADSLPGYKTVDQKNQKKFFKLGRVFLVLWTEPARDAAGELYSATSNSGQLYNTYLGGKAFTEIRRFVIVQEGYGNSICS